jgi:hypothetical protein
MRHFILAIAFMVSVITDASASKTIDRRTLSSFENDFKGATNVTWNTAANYSQAFFDLNGKKLSALYTIDGELIGTSEAVNIENLPVKAKRSLAKKLHGFTIQEALKYDLQHEVAYYIYAVKDEQALVVKVGEAGDVSVVRKS